MFRWNAAGETEPELVKGDGAHDEPASSNQRNEPFPLDASGSIGLGRGYSLVSPTKTIHLTNIQRAGLETFEERFQLVLRFVPVGFVVISPHSVDRA